MNLNITKNVTLFIGGGKLRPVHPNYGRFHIFRSKNHNHISLGRWSFYWSAKILPITTNKGD